LECDIYLAKNNESDFKYNQLQWSKFETTFILIPHSAGGFKNH